MITLSRVDSVYAIEVNPNGVTKGAISARTTALTKAQHICGLDRTAKELKVIDNIEIIKERFA